MLKSILQRIRVTKKARVESRIEERRAELKAMFREFMLGEGRLPDGFSDRYAAGTPFEHYLREIRSEADRLCDQTGISDWFHFDGGMDINDAVEAIAGWVGRHREMQIRMREKCRIGRTRSISAPRAYRLEKIMITADDGAAFDGVTEQSLRLCRENNISFCTILSDRSLFDLIERRERKITDSTYPNYHDETYADWKLD